jgi:DNA gyrase subunit B
MYLGSAGMGVAGLHHLIWEIVDNSVDEAMAGHGDRIVVILFKDGSVEVRDFGRGIPVDPFKASGRTGVARRSRSCSPRPTPAASSTAARYKVSGGLHGVGAVGGHRPVHPLDAEVWRGGRRWALSLRPREGPQRAKSSRACRSSPCATSARRSRSPPPARSSGSGPTCRCSATSTACRSPSRSGHCA